MRSERSQAQKVTYWVIPSRRTVQKRPGCRDRKGLPETGGGDGGGNGEGCLIGVSSGDDENVLGLERGDGCTALWMH